MRNKLNVVRALLTAALMSCNSGSRTSGPTGPAPPTPTPGMIMLPPAPGQSSIACDVTKPNGVVVGSDQPKANSYGNQQLSLILWPDGTVVFKPGGPGCVTREGSLAMKFPWWRGVRGQLRIEGRRLDESAPLHAIVLDGYGDIGFQATQLVFATPGCWEVTGHVGDASLTFATLVVRIGEGPYWLCDS